MQPRPAMPLLCPRCIAQRPASSLGALDANLCCPHCAMRWPQLAVDDGPSVAVLIDSEQGDAGIESAARMMGALASGPHLPPTVPEDEGHWSALSIYGGAHYGRWATPPLSEDQTHWIGPALGQVEEIPEGPAVVVGAATIGETLALPPERAVVAVDGSVPMLAFASGLIAADRRLPVQTTPGRYATRKVALPPATRERLARVQLVAADARCPPLPSGSAAIVLALNIVDSITDPRALLESAARLLRPGGVLLLSAPFQWSDEVTPPHARLDADVPPGVDHAPAIEARIEAALPTMRRRWSDHAVPWHLRVHSRMTSIFSLHAMLLQKVDE